MEWGGVGERRKEMGGGGVTRGREGSIRGGKGVKVMLGGGG